MKKNPIITLELGPPPRSGNRALRVHWRRRYRDRIEWQKRVTLAYCEWQHSRRVAGLPDEPPPPRVGQLRVVEVHWRSPRPPTDTDNQYSGFKPVLDCFLLSRIKLVYGQRATIPGSCPLLWDDDTAHCRLLIDCARGPATLRVMIWEESDWLQRPGGEQDASEELLLKALDCLDTQPETATLCAEIRAHLGARI